MIVTVAGVPWWGAFACASIAIAVGYLIDSLGGTELTMFFSVMFFVGCVAAVLLVQNKSLFTALVQPPLLMIIAVPLAYKSFATGPTQGMKSLVLDMALPLIDRFPTMAFTTIVVWAIGAFRLTLYVQEQRAKQGATGRRRSPNPTENPGARAPAASPARPRQSPPTPRPEAAFDAAGARASSPRPRPAAPAPDKPTPAAAPPTLRAARPVARGTAAGSPPAPVEQPRGARRASTAQPVGEAPRTRSSRGHRYADEAPPAGRRRREDQPRQPEQPRRGLPDLDEPSTGRRRLQQESVREFAERQADKPRYRAERPSPEDSDRPRRPAAPEPPATPAVPRLPNVRYRD